MPPPSDTAAFFLPGLVHQFGNLLLTVQGHVLHLHAEGIQRMQTAVLSVVQRGGASLQVIRALLGEQTGATGSAFDLVMQVIELGRVPARECGVSLELRGEEPKECLWVAAEPFVLACAEAVRRWIQSIPSGSAGVVTVALKPDDVGGVQVNLGFEPAKGSLPFPMAAGEVAAAIAGALQDAGGSGQILSPDGGGAPVMELRFAAANGSSHEYR